MQRPAHTTRQSEGPGTYFCPCCLKRVPAVSARVAYHRESDPGIDLTSALLCCPTCGLTLAAVVQLPELTAPSSRLTA